MNFLAEGVEITGEEGEGEEHVEEDLEGEKEFPLLPSLQIPLGDVRIVQRETQRKEKESWDARKRPVL